MIPAPASNQLYRRRSSRGNRNYLCLASRIVITGRESPRIIRVPSRRSGAESRLSLPGTMLQQLILPGSADRRRPLAASAAIHEPHGHLPAGDAGARSPAAGCFFGTSPGCPVANPTRQTKPGKPNRGPGFTGCRPGLRVLTRPVAPPRAGRKDRRNRESCG
jgi:hypothetical protein